MILNLLVRSILTPIAARQAIAASSASLSPRVMGIGGGLYCDDRLQSWPLVNYVQNRGAARRGKRIERARQARLNASKKRLLQAQNPKQKKQLKRSVNVDNSQFRLLSEREIDMTLPNSPPDDVYFFEKYRRRKHSIDEIIDFHKQAVHPDVLNVPDALVSATIELNLKMKIKRKKYIEKLESTICYPYPFKYEVKQRKIVALCKDAADQEAAREAGASIVGALDVVDQMKKNLLTQRDFDHIVCHTNFLIDFSNVKGMKGQPYFPSKSRGNFGENMGELVRYFKDGVDYSLKRNPDEPEYGFVECYFGTLSMTNEQLRENLITLFNSINRFKPLNLADDKQFFERVSITTPATSETFLLKFWELIDDYQDPDTIGLEEETEDGETKSLNA